MYIDQEFQLQLYNGQMLSSSLWISSDKQMNSRRIESFRKIWKFQLYESDKC